jgi:hypothetical protein
MHNVLTPSPNCSLSKPAPIFRCRPSPEVNKHSSGLQRKSRSFASADPIAWRRSLQPIARIIAVIAPFMCQVAALTVFESSAGAQTTPRSVRRSVRRIHRRSVQSLRAAGALDPCCDAG